jgi:hypothetical protein
MTRFPQPVNRLLCRLNDNMQVSLGVVPGVTTLP